MRRTNARAYYVQAPWTERTDDTPDVAGTKKIDLSSCAFPHDGDWFNEVPDPSFLWRCALAFSPRGLDHAKRRCRDRVAPYFFVTLLLITGEKAEVEALLASLRSSMVGRFFVVRSAFYGAGT